MNNTRKAICLLPIGLLCAVFIYPFLHELGHGLVVFLLGAKVVELQWFPLPSILCRMNSIGATEYVVAGMGGIIFPAALCLLIRCNRKFWIWYAVFICLLYNFDAADERSSLDFGGRRFIKKKSRKKMLKGGSIPEKHKQISIMVILMHRLAH